MKASCAIWVVAMLSITCLAQTPSDQFVKRYGTPDQKAKIEAKEKAAQQKPVQATDYRVVTNHVFVPAKSVYWKTTNVRCLEFSDAGITVQEFTTRKVYSTGGAVTPLQSIGAYAPPSTRTVLSETEVPGKVFILKNCPSALQPTTGKAITVQAMQTGTVAIGKDVLEVWDCGVPYSTWLSQHPKPATTNAKTQ